MTTKKRRKNRLPPFIALIRSTMETPAWRAMSPGARMLNIQLRGRLRNDHLNNGKVFLACRSAAKQLGVSLGSVVHWYAENEHYGFLRKTAEGFLGSDGRGIATKYRFTEFAHGAHPPTRDFEKWDGKMFAYTPRRPGRKKQNPVSLGDTPRVTEWHIRGGSKGSSVCVTERHIGSAPKCVTERHISRSTSTQRSGRMNQGSLMARAPAQAGDAGSSPAPVTKDPGRHSHEAIMSLVAGIVAEQLDGLSSRRILASASADSRHSGSAPALKPVGHRARPNLAPNNRRCDHCGQQGTTADFLHGWDCPGWPNGIRLHSRCEVPWAEKNR